MRSLTLFSVCAGGAAALVAATWTRDPSAILESCATVFLALGLVGCATSGDGEPSGARGRLAEGLAVAMCGLSMASAWAGL